VREQSWDVTRRALVVVEVKSLAAIT